MSRVSTNMRTMGFNRNVKDIQGRLNESMDQLSSGKKFNKISDAPLEGSRSLRMNTMLKFNERYEDNAEDGEEWLETADLALDDLNNSLRKSRDLAVQAATDSTTETDRAAIKSEVDQIKDHIMQIANTNFNDKYIFNGDKTQTEPYGEGGFAGEYTQRVDTDIEGTNFYAEEGDELENLEIEMREIDDIEEINETSTIDDLKDLLTEQGFNVTDINLDGEEEIGDIEGLDALEDLSLDDFEFNEDNKLFHEVEGEDGEVFSIAAPDNLVNSDETDNKVEIPAAFNLSDLSSELEDLDIGMGSELDRKTTFKDLDYSAGEEIDISEAEEFDATDADYYKANGDISDGDINREVFNDIVVPVNVKGEEDVGFGDILADFEELSQALEEDDTQGIKDFIDDSDDHIENTLRVRARAGARKERLEMNRSRLEGQEESYTRILSRTEDVDYAETITEMKEQENVYRAALSTGARVIQPSLVDFL